MFTCCGNVHAQLYMHYKNYAGYWDINASPYIIPSFASTTFQLYLRDSEISIISPFGEKKEKKFQDKNEFVEGQNINTIII